MKKITKLIYLLQTTRSMPQHGYALVGGNQRLGNLAEHHYLVTAIAWQLAKSVKEAGGEISLEKVLEFSLIHDLGEIFGSDISMPYAKVNPEAKKHAKAFESENQKFLARFFGDNKDGFEKMSEEILDAKSDEALICKIADYVEVTMYKQFLDKYSQKDYKLIKPKIEEKIEKIKNEITRKKMEEFASEWFDELESFSSFDEKIKDILNE